MLLPNDPKHVDECHERWLKRSFRVHVKAEERREEWRDQQCMFCRFFVPLTGAFIEDWGVCSNADSPADGTVRFEHDGCPAFQEGEWWTQEESEPSPAEPTE